MGFRQKHPYLFWQLIGWWLIAADAAFLVLSALKDFGEWCYPIIVFIFIIGLFFVAASPVIVRLTRRRLIPQNSDAYTERLFNGKISALMTVRRGAGFGALAAVFAFGSIIVFIFAAYILGDRVHLALGFACMVLAVVSPFLIIGIHSANTTRRFFTVKNGEKLVNITAAPDPIALGEENPPTLIVSGEPNAVLLNFFRNWLQPYLRGERLTLYRITASELCRYYLPNNILRYEDVLFCIPTAQLDLTAEKAAMFGRECGIMGALTFGVFVVVENTIAEL